MQQEALCGLWNGILAGDKYKNTSNTFVHTDFILF